MRIKHSKYKNTGLLFELLVRQITADTLSGGESPSLDILKKSFAKTELGKEYKLYESLFKNKNLSEGKADITLNTILEATRKLNRSALRREKYNLINEIRKHYNLEEFFRHQVPNYKGYAAFYKLIEIFNSDKLSETDKQLLLEELRYDMLEMEETTKRWVSDNQTDSYLTRNIRPLTLAFLTATLFVYIILDSSLEGFKIDPNWIDLLSSLLLLVYGGYFGMRSAEKITKHWKK